MTKKDENAPGGHPLFRAMVMMGGSLAVGCGGTVATVDSKSVPHGTSGRGGFGGAGRATLLMDGGAPPGAGGMAGAPSLGGSAGQAEPVIECIAAQWDCAGIAPECADGHGLQLPVGCSCDPARPKSAADCTVPEAFVCHRATVDQNGQPLASEVMFDCACLSPASACSDTCKSLDSSLHRDGYDCGVLPDEHEGVAQSILCGCGWVYLK